MCTKTRLWAAIVKPDSFRLLAGKSELIDYQPDTIHHVFCPHCGVRSFAWGESPDLGGKFYAVRVSCLDDVDIDELMNAPITYHDGRNDNTGLYPLRSGTCEGATLFVLAPLSSLEVYPYRTLILGKMLFMGETLSK